MGLRPDPAQDNGVADGARGGVPLLLVARVTREVAQQGGEVAGV